MKKFLLLTVICCLIVSMSQAQTIDQSARDAFVITRMAAKFHVQPREVDELLSTDLFDALIRQLDEEKVFFTAEDMGRLLPYRPHLSDELLRQQTGFLKLLVSIYLFRLEQSDTMIQNIARLPFHFTGNDKLTAAEDSSFAINQTARHSKLYKQVKAATLTALLDMNDELSEEKPDRKRKMLDSLEIVFRKKSGLNFKRLVNRILQSPGGVASVVGNAYCECLANCYDPHSDYFPPSQKENFENLIGNAPYQFGFSLNEDDEGDVEINSLKPGSPAFKCGQLNKGDRIQSVQWEGKDPIDVTGAGPREMNDILSASNHEKITLTVKKPDGTLVKVTLMKEKASDAGEENRVKSFILKGDKSIGYISLPAFYTDWQTDGQGLDGCADDVAKEIIKLKKENIDGLILDLRFNGGGSMKEATELAGIFIDAGPVGEIKPKTAKLYTLKDMNRGTIYDGPLILMVNGLSASASEMVAGTLQDYHRALVVGSPTYGKATAQVVLPMDTTISLEENNQNKKSESYIKLTTDKLYRVTGRSAQASGVIPDVSIPDLLEADPHREINEKDAFPNSSIEANKYFKPYPAMATGAFQAYADKFTDTAAYFKQLKRFVQVLQANRQPQDISLNWKDALSARSAVSGIDPPVPPAINKRFTVTNHAYEERRLQADPDLREQDENWKKKLAADPYLNIAYGILSMPGK